MKQIISNEDLPQGSQKWLDLRSKYGMASEVGSLLGVSKWDPKTPLALWNIKNGITKIETNYAMEHGNKYEDEAREMFEEDMGGKWSPVVILNDECRDEDLEVPIGASLDGYREKDNSILEIKCPLKGSVSELWQEVSKTQRLPEQYWLQCQQQLLVAESEKLYFWVYDAKSAAGLLQIVYPHKEAQVKIVNAWIEYFATGRPEPLPEDLVESEDKEWLKKAKEWREINVTLQVFKEKEEKIRKDLIELSKGQSYIGGGVQLKHGMAKGRINYGKIPELQDIDLEPFRGGSITKHYLKVV
jgi:putative phage-type endonuclease